MIPFVLAHKTTLLLGAAWLFSSFCSTMPPLPDKAGYMLTWAHNFLQTAAGNIDKIRNK